MTQFAEHYVESPPAEMEVMPAAAATLRSAGPGSPSSRRLGRLIGMRFFAALAVVLCHVGYQFTNTNSVNVAESYGYVGVSFFFGSRASC